MGKFIKLHRVNPNEENQVFKILVNTDSISYIYANDGDTLMRIYDDILTIQESLDEIEELLLGE